MVGVSHKVAGNNWKGGQAIYKTAADVLNESEQVKYFDCMYSKVLVSKKFSYYSLPNIGTEINDRSLIEAILSNQQQIL